MHLVAEFGRYLPDREAFDQIVRFAVVNPQESYSTVTIGPGNRVFHYSIRMLPDRRLAGGAIVKMRPLQAW